MGKRPGDKGGVATAAKLALVATLSLLTTGCERAPEDNAQGQAANEQGTPAKEPTRRSRLQETDQALAPALGNETIAPYLLSRHETSATICWVSREPSLGSVVVHGPGDTKTFTAADEASRFHKVAITGLVPGTQYRYEVGKNYRGTFETVGPQTAFRVAVFGHTGGTDEPREYPTQLLASQLSALRPDVTLCTGDIVYHSNIADFRDTFFRPFARLLEERPIYVAASNHDCSWPWLHGIDYGNVRKLFPHDYASNKGAYYQFTHKNTSFFAVSYVQSAADFKQQTRWLVDALQASTSEFNIVYLGGQEPLYYDKDYFFKQISSAPVDLVLGGDGGGVWQAKYHGVPFFFAGDGSDKHHPFYWLSVKDYRFSVRVRDSGGNSRNKLWQFFSTRPKQTAIALEAKQQPTAPHIARFASIGLPSDKFDGLEFDIDWPFDQELPLQVRWRPASKKRLGGEQSYRLQYLMLLPQSKQKMRIAIPDKDPLTGKPYELDWLQIEPVAYKLKKAGLTVDLAKHLTNVRMFQDR